MLFTIALLLSTRRWFSPGYVGCINLSTSRCTLTPCGVVLYPSPNLQYIATIKRLELFLGMTGLVSSISAATFRYDSYVFRLLALGVVDLLIVIVYFV